MMMMMRNDASRERSIKFSEQIHKFMRDIHIYIFFFILKSFSMRHFQFNQKFPMFSMRLS